MKAVILAGGFGTRISEESYLRPKPMIEIGTQPILWHIMKYFSCYGVKDFVICLGYKSHVIKSFFANYMLYTSDVTLDLKSNGMQVHNNEAEDWRVSLVETGLHTMTGGRLKRIRDYVKDEPFFMTYGDGVCDVDLKKLVAFHRAQGKLATMTAVRPEGRFGILDMEGDMVRSFREKAQQDMGLINGGYMVLEPQVLDYIEGDATVFEREPLERLADEGQLCAYRHDGFWQCMDTQRDKRKLEALWSSGEAPWKIWKD